MPNHVTHPPSDVFVEQLLSSVLGKEQAARLCALMEQIGLEEEEIIMGLIQEIIQSHEQIQEGNVLIAYLRRRLFGQKRERYIDPNQGDLFPGIVGRSSGRAKTGAMWVYVTSGFLFDVWRSDLAASTVYQSGIRVFGPEGL